MRDQRPARTPPSGAPDGDGVRVTQLPRDGARHLRRWVVGAAAVAAVGIAWLALGPDDGRPQARAAERSNTAVAAASTPLSATRASATQEDAPRPTPAEAPDDLAAYFEPGDPEPTGAELIDALHTAGVRTGIGAFNPPGTSPVLTGLAVPKDFVLPPGYVRHHQVTDEGVPLEPILMFSPDFSLYDAQGRAIPLPADRVVPPQFAPPGLPLRRVHARTP